MRASRRAASSNRSGTTAEASRRFGDCAAADRRINRPRGRYRSPRRSPGAARLTDGQRPLPLGEYPVVRCRRKRTDTALRLYGLFADPSTVQRELASLSGVPSEIRDVLAQQLASLARQSNGSLGFGVVVSVVLALCSASNAAAALITSLNVAYDEKVQQDVRISCDGRDFTDVVLAVRVFGDPERRVERRN